MLNFVLQPASCFSFSSLSETKPYWVTHTKSWTHVIEKSFPHIKGYIAANSTTLDSDCSFLPVYRIKQPLKKVSWLSIPYATISDPLLRKHSTSKSFIETLINNPLVKNYPIEIRASSKLSFNSELSLRNGFCNHQLYLNGDENEIFRRFHRSAVQVHIRKSLHSGITMRKGTSINDVIHFYKIYIKTRSELGLPPQPFRFFKNMWLELYPHNLELLFAQYNGKPVAGMWVLKNKWLYSFEYLARAQRRDKLCCTHFLYWQGIRNALKEGIPVVSFGRMSTRNKGLNTFKQRWGTKIVPYYDYKYPFKKEETREDSKLYKTMQKYSPKLPLPVFRLLGEIIYRLI